MRRLLKLVGTRPERPPLRGLVLDLRGNPGGVLESAVSVADAFLEDGVIVRADGRTPEARFEMDASAGDLLAGRPIVVLVDGGSASGSEIVAGALRDHSRATLMGERTFGKGSVQTVIPLRDGQALKLTTSKYFTPSGTSIHDRGHRARHRDRRSGRIAPSARCPRRRCSRSKDPAVQTALQYLRDRGLGAQYAAVALSLAEALSPPRRIAPISMTRIGRTLSPKPALRWLDSRRSCAGKPADRRSRRGRARPPSRAHVVREQATWTAASRRSSSSVFCCTRK